MYSRRKLKHWRRRKTELEKMGIGYNEGRYKLSSVARQDPADHVYCCALNSVSPNHADKLATTAGPRAYVYRLTTDGNMTLMQCYVDEDLEEDYFACCWCASAIPGNEGAMLAVAGGYKGVVRVIDCTKEGVYVNLRGHGGGVNDVKAHPTSPHLLLTASKDESCRLWNMDSKVCIAVFAGALGHRNEVLSVDFKAGLDPYDAKEPADVVFVSGAMDNQIKVWSTDGYDGLIKQSDGWREDAGKKFPTAHVQTPSFSSHKVHGELSPEEEVEQVLDLRGDLRGVVLPHHRVPRRAELLVHALLDELRRALEVLRPVLLHRARANLHSLVPHLALHVAVLDQGVGRHLDVRVLVRGFIHGYGVGHGSLSPCTSLPRRC